MPQTSGASQALSAPPESATASQKRDAPARQWDDTGVVAPQTADIFVACGLLDGGRWAVRGDTTWHAIASPRRSAGSAPRSVMQAWVYGGCSERRSSSASRL